MGGEERQIAGASDVAHGACVEPLLPATDDGGTARAVAHASAYPARPVRVIVTSGPGGQGEPRRGRSPRKSRKIWGNPFTSRTWAAVAAISPYIQLVQPMQHAKNKPWTND
jgi:hypothetical protein